MVKQKVCGAHTRQRGRIMRTYFSMNGDQGDLRV